MILLLDRFSRRCGDVLAWLVLLMMLACCAVVLLRYALAGGEWVIFLQELLRYMHGTMFMLALAATMARGRHVRVDLLQRRMDRRQRAWVDSLGTLVLLFPLAAFMLFGSLDFAARSWMLWESSTEPGGIPAVFVLKSMIPLAALLLMLQGLVELVRNAMILCRD